MISKREFIERARAVQDVIKKFEKLMAIAEQVFGANCFDNIYNTGIISELINCLAATIDDKDDWVSWVMYEREGDFPITDCVWFNGELTNFKDWGDIYDIVQRENRLKEEK